MAPAQQVAAPPARAERGKAARTVSTFFASLAFLLLVAGITYFALLVLSVHYGENESRARAYRELGLYLSGGLEWYRDARILGASSLLAGLISLLFGVHPFARITIPVAGLLYLTLPIFVAQIYALIPALALFGTYRGAPGSSGPDRRVAARRPAPVGGGPAP